MINDPVPLQPHHIRRIVADLAESELASLRRVARGDTEPGSTGLASSSVRRLDADSVELLAVASAVDRMFHLHESGYEDSLLGNPSVSSWSDIVAASMRVFSHCLTFSSARGGGAPRVVTHPLSRLKAEAERYAALIPGRRRVVSLVPSHRVYGFVWTILLPEVAGIECIDARDWTPGQVQSRARGGDLVVGSPYHWSPIDEQVLWANDVVGVASMAACPADVVARQRARGLSRMVEIYGCTEYAGIGWRDDPARPYALLDAWERCHAGTAVRLDGSPPDADLTRVEDGEAVGLPDRLEWEDARHFRIAGRRTRVSSAFDTIVHTATALSPSHAPT